MLRNTLPTVETITFSSLGNGERAASKGQLDVEKSGENEKEKKRKEKRKRKEFSKVRENKCIFFFKNTHTSAVTVRSEKEMPTRGFSQPDLSSNSRSMVRCVIRSHDGCDASVRVREAICV